METPTDTRNWRQVIDEAEKRGSFTYGEKMRSDDWFSCACGDLHPLISKGSDGAPCDYDLTRLGKYFGSAVFNNQFATALRLLDAIEAREAELLREMGVRP